MSSTAIADKRTMRRMTTPRRALLGILVLFGCAAVVPIQSSYGQVDVICLEKLVGDGGLLSPGKNPFGRREHAVRQVNGDEPPRSLPAELQWISQPWENRNAQMPYLVYMPEKDRLLMLAAVAHPIPFALTTSDDHGKTWSKRRHLTPEEAGQPPRIGLGLTYLGQGKLLAFPEDNAVQWVSSDYGATWTVRTPQVPTEGERNSWDPIFIVRNAQGGVERLVQAWWRPTGIPWGSDAGAYSQAYLRSSTDEARTWSDDQKVPQWLGVNEVEIIKAANGDWVAACRTDYPKRFAHFQFDHYGGLATSISKDKGKTWSELKPLYEWGRHHPSMVLLRDGNIVMSYVVRLGYPDTNDGFPQYGVEAVVSKDNGQTWDLEHRYVLATWVGNRKGKNDWFCSVQSTSTVLLPDGTLLTAFGTGFTNTPETKACKMDVALVTWRLDAK